MRSRHLIHKDIFTALGGNDIVAGVCTVEPGTVKKWGEDPNESGRDIPFVKFQKVLIASAKHMTNLPLQNHIDEYLQDHVLGLCHRRVYLADRIFDLIEVLQNGNRGRV